MVPDLGSRHDLTPRARSTKFCTVIGVSNSKSLTTISPIEVRRVAYKPGSRSGAAGFGCVSGVCAASPAASRIREIVVRMIYSSQYAGAWQLARRLFVIVLLASAAYAQKVAISVLATTDMHGNLYPIDYFTDRPAARGLARMATLIREARKDSPNSLLIDCGDTIQGSPLESVYQSYLRTGQFPLGLT